MKKYLAGGFIILAIVLLAVAGYLFYGMYSSPAKPPAAVNAPTNTNSSTNTNTAVNSNQPLEMKQFASADDFTNYIKLSGNYSANGFGGTTALRSVAVSAPGIDVGLQTGAATGLGAPENQAAAARVSETNVQVAGIDEPDIVKTDGKNIFYSQTQRYFYPPSAVPMAQPNVSSGSIMPAPPVPQDNQANTEILKAWPPAELAKIGGITEVGNLLLSGNNLLIFTNDNKIYGYDISLPAVPKEKWNVTLEPNNYLIQSRLFGSSVYLVIRQGVSQFQPCPLNIMSQGNVKVSVACTEIYHPVSPVTVDSTYTALKLDPATGQTLQQVTFVGSAGSSVIYMSNNFLYVTYAFYPDMISFMADFFEAKAADLIPAPIIQKLKKLSSYDLSSAAKMTEFQVIMENFNSSLNADDQLKLGNELSNRLSDYLKDHGRELEQSGIVKIDNSNLNIAATGQVPGRPLNQFSLDEYQNNLRIAVTVGQSFGLGQAESFSDVYILDGNLKPIGSVKDLGRGESIYSARFIEGRGYVVTFKQTDPFFVLDLADPATAALKGELKLPGNSSYLHPISKDIILGIGQDQSRVKVSLFDVSDPANPTEASKYNLDEYWTGVASTHHAFLLDAKHNVFFLPGSKGGYIFSYKNNQLKLEAAVSEPSVQRAIYLNDYLYVIGENKITVFDENNWRKVKEFQL